MTLEGGDRWWVYGERTWQALDAPFAPVPGVSFPAGASTFDRIGLVAYSEQSRLFSAGGNVGVGRYFLADFVRAQGQVGFSPLPHIGLFLNYELSRFDGEGVRPGGVSSHLLQLEGSRSRRGSSSSAATSATRPATWASPTRGSRGSSAFQVPGAPPSEQRLVVKGTYTWRP